MKMKSMPSVWALEINIINVLKNKTLCTSACVYKSLYIQLRLNWAHLPRKAQNFQIQILKIESDSTMCIHNI